MGELPHDGSGQPLSVSARNNVLKGSGNQINGFIAQLNQYFTQTGSNEAQYLQDLFITNPRDDKQRIQNAAGGTLPAACEWVLSQAPFQAWRKPDGASLLWIKGGPGTGKTMMLGYIIDQLIQEREDGDSFAYFFCGHGNRDADNASAVLRGLCYMLVTPSNTLDTASTTLDTGLLDIVREICDATGGVNAFGGSGAWFRLERIFRRFLHDLSTRKGGGTIYLLVDALNECDDDLGNLLKLVVDTTDSDALRVKWLLTSHPSRRSGISKALNIGGTDTRHGMDLDDYPDQLSRAVELFIDNCAERIAGSQKGLNVEEVRNLLRRKVGRRHSFLYAALLTANARKARDHEELLDMFKNVAQDVTGLHQETISRIHDLEDDVRRGCLDALGAVAMAYRPLHYVELQTLILIELDTTANRVRQECETFFVVEQNWEVQVVNQSARDFLRNSPLTPSLEDQHRRLFSQSLKTMQRLFQRDMCQLIHPGYTTDDLKPEHQEMLGGVGYPCQYWIEHLVASGHCNIEPKDLEAVHKFLEEKFLNWVEVMSLLGSGRDALLSWSKLANFLQGTSKAERLIEFVTDARRFLEFNAESIFKYPLQTYTSALVFAPTSSVIKNLFAEQEEPSWVSIGSGMERPQWSPWVRTLNPKTSGVVVVESACFSPDGAWVAAFLRRKNQSTKVPASEVVVWDLETGAVLCTLPRAARCIGFPPLTSRLAIVMGRNVDFWDLTRGCWDESERINNLSPVCAAFSLDGIWLAAATGESGGKVEIWEWGVQDFVLSFSRPGNHVPSITSIAFSSNGPWLATADREGVRVWNHKSGDCWWEIDIADTTVAFSKSFKDLVVLAKHDILTAWNWKEAKRVHKLVVEKNPLARDVWNPVALSADGSRFAVAKPSMSRVWDATTRRRIQQLSGYDDVRALCFSPDGRQLALGDDYGLKICETTSTDLREIQEDKSHRGKIKWIKVLADGKRVASVSVDVVIVWDARTGRQVSKIKPDVDIEPGAEIEPEVRIEPQDGDLLDASFSGDGSHVVLVHRHNDPKVWNIKTSKMSDSIPEAAAGARLSPDGQRAALVDFEGSVKVWNLEERQFDCDDMDYGSGSPAGCIAFAPKSDLIAVSSGGEVTTWELSGHRWRQKQAMTDTGTATVTSLCFSSDGTHLVGSTENESTIWDISSGDPLGNVGGLEVGIRVVGFNAYSPFIQTSLGLFVTDDAGVDTELRWGGAFDLRKLRRQGFGLDENMSWVTWGSHRVLWLPPEYRPNSVAVLPVEESRHMESSLIALGCRSGRVVFLRFPRNASPLTPARERSSEDNL